MELLLMKIYLTLVTLLILGAGVCCVLMNTDSNREEMWRRVGIGCLLSCGFLTLLGVLVGIWI